MVGGGHELLERERQLQRIDTAAAQARAGHGGVLVVEGVAGVGKTRLLHAAAGAAAASDLRVLRARGSELERAMAFGVARQLFEPTLARADHEERTALLRHAADLARGPLGLPAAGPSADGYAALHGLFWLCANLAESTPVVLVVDDAHWCDDESASWLAYLARRVEDLPVLVLLATRPDEARPVLRALVADRVAEALPLRALGDDAVQRVLEDAFPAATDAFRQACLHASGGNPLLLWEMVDALRDARLAGSDDDALQVEALGAASVASYVRSRLERLGPEALALGRAGAILGDGASFQLAAELAGLTPTVADHAADDLRAAHILRSDDALGFVHPVVGAAVLGEMLPGARGDAHAAAARALAAQGADDARVAAHLLQAPPRGDAWVVEALRAAAADAVAAGAPDAATRLLDRALAEPPPAPARADVLVSAGQAAFAADPAVAVERFEQALAHTVDPARRAWVVRLLAKALAHADQPARAIALLEDALADLGDLDAESRLLLESERLLWRAFWFENRGRDADLARLETLVEGIGASTPGERSVRALLAWQRVLTGVPAADALSEARLASAPGRLLTDPAMGFEVPITTVLTHLFCGALEEALERFDQGIAELQDAGRLVELTFTFAHRAHARLRLGSLREAEADARTSWRLAAQLGPRAAAWWYAFGPMVETLLARGAVDEAQALVVATGTGGASPDAVIFPLPRLVRGRLAAALGDHRQAVEELLLVGRQMEQQGIHNPSWCPWQSSVAPSLAAIGRRDEARVLMTEAIADARRFGALPALGAALRVAGELDDDAEQLAESVAVLRGSSARAELAASLVAQGSALRRSKQRTAARVPLREGLELAERCAADGLAARAREELAAAGGRHVGRPTTGVRALTASELRVSRRAASGLTNGEIAQDLFVTRKTVEKHLASAYRKLDCTRGELSARLADDPPLVD